jgi:putative transposase
MPRGLERYYGDQDFHFITFSCYGRRPLLDSKAARDLFVKVLGEVRLKYGFWLFGYVLMPEHVHLLMSEPPNSTPSKVLQILKQSVARQLRDDDFVLSRLPQFWQPRFHDFNVWSMKKLNEKLHYMHMNPVKRTLVQEPGEWPWSSYSFYWGKGTVLLKMDRPE